jgi:hypothetical protein
MDRLDSQGKSIADPEMRYEVWAERLEREFSLLLIPYMDPKLDVDRIRIISARMAMLAAKRAREASALDDDDDNLVKCSGCRVPVVKATASSLCFECLSRLKLIPDGQLGI